MQLAKQVQIPKVLSTQFVLVLILISGYSWIIIDSDITFFDHYVLEDISYCNPDRYEQEHCKSLREVTGCVDSMDQLCIGNIYWRQVEKQAYGLAVILFLARIIPSAVNHITGKRKFDKIAVIDATWWALLALIIFLFGVIDFGYYVLRGMDIPETLNWLDNVGVFVDTKTLTGDPTVVDAMDLKLTFLLGFGAMGALLFVVSGIYRLLGSANRKQIR
jgi:hypothetical protein